MSNHLPQIAQDFLNMGNKLPITPASDCIETVKTSVYLGILILSQCQKLFEVGG